jgi:biopolymer transport protein ExbD
MRVKRPNELDEEVGFNLTPIIDCLLFLNLFFMLATTFKDTEKALDVNLPEAKAGRPENNSVKEVIINVMNDGRMKVGDRVMDSDGLIEHLKQVAMVDKNTPITIRGDRGTEFQNAVRAMDACSRAQLKRVAVGILDDGAHGRAAPGAGH